MSNLSPRSTALAPVPARQGYPSAPSDEARSWTPERQAAFLATLAATHNVARAARSVGMSRQSAYRLRARLHGEPFDRAWAAAFQCHFDALAEAAMERALNGIEVPHYHKGELIGTSRRFDERLTLGLLAMRDSFWRPPAPYTSAASGFARDELARLIERVAKGPPLWNDDRRRLKELTYWDAQPEAACDRDEPVNESDLRKCYPAAIGESNGNSDV